MVAPALIAAAPALINLATEFIKSKQTKGTEQQQEGSQKTSSNTNIDPMKLLEIAMALAGNGNNNQQQPSSANLLQAFNMLG